MSQRKIFTGLVLTMLMSLSFTVHANSDSTRIGISLEIKGKQACDYSYVMENKASLNSSMQAQFSNCDISARKLQQQVNQIGAAEFKTTQLQLDGKRLRVFMTVQ